MRHNFFKNFWRRNRQYNPALDRPMLDIFNRPQIAPIQSYSGFNHVHSGYVTMNTATGFHQNQSFPSQYAPSFYGDKLQKSKSRVWSMLVRLDFLKRRPKRKD